MDKYDILLVRACKSNSGNTLKRLRRIWRHRCGFPKGLNLDEADAYMGYHLMEIIINEKLDVQNFIRTLWVESAWQFEGDGFDVSNPTQNKLSRIASHFRLTKIGDFSYFIVPAKFRKGGCGNPQCCVSRGIHSDCECKGFTFGSGELDEHGYWEFPCYDCARSHEQKYPEDGVCWPFDKRVQTRVD